MRGRLQPLRRTLRALSGAGGTGEEANQTMGNAVIIGILIIVGFFALRSALKHFKGEGGCCGAGSVPKQKKKIRDARFRRVIQIEGMHCENCRNSVEKAINELEGAAARVDLKKNTAQVVMEKEIPDELLIRAVEKAGFQVKSIRPA